MSAAELTMDITEPVGDVGEAPILTQADYERLAEFRYLLRKFLVFSEEAAERAGLTAQQHQALLVIRQAR